MAVKFSLFGFQELLNVLKIAVRDECVMFAPSVTQTDLFATLCQSHRKYLPKGESNRRKYFYLFVFRRWFITVIIWRLFCAKSFLITYLQEQNCSVSKSVSYTHLDVYKRQV